MLLPAIQLRHLLRRLARSPLFSLVTIFTIALAVGANTSIFSVLNGILLKPLPFPEPDRLIAVWLTAPGLNIKDAPLAPSMYFIFREQGKTWEDIGLWTGDSVNITGRGAPEQVEALDVTDGTLPLLRVQPLLGRIFTRKDDTPGSPQSAVLTYGYWQRRFGGSTDVIGKRVLVDGVAHQIIGVLPKSFHFLDRNPSLLMPLQFDRSKTYLGNFSFQSIARLKPGATIQQANAEIAHLIPVVLRSFPAFPGFNADFFWKIHMGPNTRTLKQDLIGDLGNTLWALMATIGIVLLIACANVANLLLVRAEGRQQEIAVRIAIGASRRQIAAELFSESIALGLAGGIIGLGLSLVCLRFLIALAPADLPRLSEISIDGHVLLFTLVISVIAGLLFGSIPVFKYARAGVSPNLRQGGRTLSQSRERHRARGVLVVVQVALALVLLISSGLMIRTSRALLNVQPGFTDPASLQTMVVAVPEGEVKEPERVLQMQADMLTRVRAIPGVASATFVSTVPMDGTMRFDPIFVEDRHENDKQPPPIRRYKFITPDSFRTLGTPLLAGRDFTWTDLFEKRAVAIVSETVARELWGSPASALGKRIREGTTGPWREVVAVAGNTYDDGVNQKPSVSVYWPAMMHDFEGDKVAVRRSMTLLVRSNRAGSESLVKQMEAAVWSLDPNIPAANVRTVEEIYRKSMARTSFTLVIFSIAGGMALLLGIVGIYGVIAYSVAQRTREIGIRLALGAQQSQLSAMFLRQGLLLTLAGVTCGLAVAFLVLRVASSLLFGVTANDPLTYAAVSAGLLTVAALATYVPSRRAARVDPSSALQAE
jgi:predicted permease